MDQLEVLCTGKSVKVTYSYVEGCRCDKLFVNIVTFQQEAMEVLQAVRTHSKFVAFGTGYTPTETCDISDERFKIPYMYCCGRNDELKVGYTSHENIPHEWLRYYTVTLDTDTIRAFDRFFELFNTRLTLDEQEIAQDAINSQRKCTFKFE